MLKIRYSSQFKKDYKASIKRGYDISLFEEVLIFLTKRETLPNKYMDHQLVGQYKGYRECHILPDWLLIYKIDEDALTLVLIRMGTHSDLF